MKRVRKEIGGQVYVVGCMPTMQGVDVMVDLAQLMAPAFEGKAADVDLAKLLDEDAASLLPKLFAVAKGANKDKVKAIIKALAAHTVVDREDGPQHLEKVLQTHFSGDFGALIQWLGFAIGVNFLGFTEDSESDELAGWIKEKTSQAETGAA